METGKRPASIQVLTRAKNVLTQSGDPIPALHGSTTDPGSSSDSVGLSRRFSLSSIKKKFKDVKAASIERSRQFSFSSSSDSLPKRRGHARAQSDLESTRPKVVHSNSAPEPSLSIAASGTSTAPLQHIPESTETSSSSKRRSSIQKDTMDISVPALLQTGTPMTKVSANKQKRVVFRLDPDQGQIIWESKNHRIIPIENIKELRVGADARFYREQFQLSQDYEDRWLTIVYILDGEYKTLHLIAATKDVFKMWDVTLRQLHGIRQELMSGLGNLEMRQALWEKQYWKGADEESDQKLDFDDVQRLCKRLNISTTPTDLLRVFKQADSNNRGYLDFTDFRRFVKILKTRPELDRLYKKLCKAHGGPFDFSAFEKFARDTQKSSLSQTELRRIFDKYAGAPDSDPSSTGSTNLGQSSGPSELAHAASDSSASKPGSTSTASAQPAHVMASQTSTSPPSANPVSPTGSPPTIMSLEGFTAFLISPDNSAFTDQPRKVWQDMTRPLSEYYISSSHNTYLVGHQLVGVSTIEGYIRALLHSCRSVELDIYDGDTEPVIFHGKTFTSKVSLRDVCLAIAKYGFVASPYPVIISAEVHCGLVQQDMMAKIMKEVFGEALVSAPLDGRPKIESLPSPEELKGRFLLKAKSLSVTEKEGIQEKGIVVDAESSETSSTDSDVVQSIKSEWRRSVSADPVKELKQEFAKARNVMNRVRGVTPPPAIVPSVASLQPPRKASKPEQPTVKMSFALAALLVYTVGVKCRGINKKEEYAPEHVFSLSEGTANKVLKQGIADLIKHNRTHIVRIYPKGLRLNSTNYEPHRYWAAGAQLVAINWQTCDLGYMINHAMFQRNGRSGYVLKPSALRVPDKDLLSKRTKHFLDITIISAQQVPRPRDSSGREIIDKSIVDPYVEVSIHMPDWTHSPFLPQPSTSASTTQSAPSGNTTTSQSSVRTVSFTTGVVKNNGFNPVWQEAISLPFDCVADMKDLIFVRFAVKQEDAGDNEPLAVYCASLGSLQHGYRHLPLHDAQMSQFLFSTLFVKIGIHDA